MATKIVVTNEDGSEQVFVPEVQPTDFPVVVIPIDTPVKLEVQQG